MADEIVVTQEAIDIGLINIGGLRYISDMHADLIQICRMANWAYHGRITPKEAKKEIQRIIYQQLCCGDSSCDIGGSTSCGCTPQERVVDFSAPFIVTIFPNKAWFLHINFTEFINNGQGEMIRCQMTFTMSPNTRGSTTFSSWCTCTTNPGVLEVHGPNHKNMDADADVAAGSDGSTHFERFRDNIRTSFFPRYQEPVIERSSKYIIPFPLTSSKGSSPVNPILVRPGATIVITSTGATQNFYLYRTDSNGRPKNPNKPNAVQNTDAVVRPPKLVHDYEASFTLDGSPGRMFLITADILATAHAPAVYFRLEDNAPNPPFIP
jgi:hypothetical protein